ncbi:MAG: helix-turn-helix domain-containing protein [Candidatus Woesearchaeota archaeon]|nr:MAG: helix-turn-helix domain-containing protein [Candidatus Woesearchaeota archaeon]
MKKKSKTCIHRIRKLRSEKHSFKEIAKILGISVSTVYMYSKDIRVNRDWSIKRCKNIKKQKGIDRSKVRLIGHCLWDGSITPKRTGSYSITYSNCSRKLIDLFILDMKRTYGINPTTIIRKKGKNIDYYIVYFCSRLVCEDLLNYTPTYSTANGAKFPKIIWKLDRNLKKEFIKTFWEDEGSINHYGKIKASLKSKSILEKLDKLQQQFRISSCVGFDKATEVYYIYIRKNRNNLQAFWSLYPFEYAVIKRGKNVGRLRKDVFLENYERILFPSSGDISGLRFES